MKSKDYWQAFEHTGSIQNYLSYKQQQTAEDSCRPRQEEQNAHADRHSGPGASGSKGGGIG